MIAFLVTGILWTLAGVVFFWVGALIFYPSKALYLIVRAFTNASSLEEWKAKRHTHKLYKTAQKAKPLTHEQFGNLVFTQHLHAMWLRLPEDFRVTVIETIFALHEEGELGPFPTMVFNSVEGARYRDMLSRYTAPTIDPQPLTDALSAFLSELHIPTGNDLTIPVADHLADVRETVQRIMLPFYSEECRTSGAFNALRKQFEKNFEAVKHVLPTEYKGDNVVFTYLHDTPLLQLFDARVPFGIPEIARYEGQWIVAPQGAGKTQFIQYQISKLLDQKCSIIVIDSQEEMIRTLSHIKAIKDRLILIDANDVEYPLAFNIFDLGHSEHLSPLEQERRLNTALEVVGFLLDSLLGADLTSKQEVVFRFITQALLAIPNATILTFLDMLQHGIGKHQDHIDTLEGAAQSFFETQFNDREFAKTKTEIIRRLYGILGIRAWERMFTQPKTKLDLFAEMNAGKIILINTASSLLKAQGCEVFGRFFIALIAMAAQKRATLTHKLPVHVFIDELRDYFPRRKEDDNNHIVSIIEQCRKQKIALTVAHQHCSQISPRMKSTLQTVAIKCTSTLTKEDADALAPGMKCKPEQLTDQPRGTFACYVRNVTTKPVNLHVPFGVLEAMECMTDQEYEELKATMRAKYAVAKTTPTPKVADVSTKVSDPVTEDHPHTTPPPRQSGKFSTDIDIFGD